MPDVKARIGLFGGSFNPVHKGHIQMANYAIEQLKLDELIFIPCYQSVDKDAEQYVSAKHRIAMLLMVLPKKCSISTFEIKKYRPVQTIETLKHFRSIFKEAELFFIMGVDNLATIHTWKDYDKLDEYAHLVVFRRNGDNTKYMKGLRVRYMTNDFWDYSANNVRTKSLSGTDIKVEVYIRENKLYGYAG